MNKNRPVNLDISTISLPITSYVSILHRASGIVLFFGVAVLMWMLEMSLASEEGFKSVQEHLSSPLCQIIIWGVLAALAYHLVAGIRHMIMDLGIGETLEGGKLGAKIVIAVSAILIILAAGVVGLW
ncbi:MAG: succinate dehydrogenase, cytochrome b556 subunit [Cellvibrionaceae bacterium]